MKRNPVNLIDPFGLADVITFRPTDTGGKTVGPQIGVLGLAATGIELAHWRLVGMQGTSFSKQRGQLIGQRLQGDAYASDRQHDARLQSAAFPVRQAMYLEKTFALAGEGCIKAKYSSCA